MSSEYPRDLIGYGQKPPNPLWPNNAKLALQFVINYEEGGENCILHGDRSSEAFLSDIPGATPLDGFRNLNVESMFEYGSRAGFWRLHRIFSQRKIPVTVFAVAMALQRNPEAATAMVEAGWEVASHGYRWIDYQYVHEEVERTHIRKAIAILASVTGSRPLGFYQGRVSPNTRRLVVEEKNFLYDADGYADDLPYWNNEHGKPHLIIPYTLDNNDMRFATQSLNTGDEFFTYLKNAFDVLYAEGDTSPKMMSVGLHCRLSGRPGRAATLSRFLNYVQSHENVWICRRVDIARHWHSNHKCKPPETRRSRSNRKSRGNQW